MKMKHCADMIDKGNGMGYADHFMKKDYLKKGHNTSGKTNMSNAQDGATSEQMLAVVGPNPEVGPPAPWRPTNPNDGEWFQNSDGSWSLSNYDDANYAKKKRQASGQAP